MSTYTQILYQVVFSTRRREKTLSEESLENLHKYIHGLLTAKKCKVYQIGGVEDHLHLLFDLHPTQALSPLVKDIKLATSDYIKRTSLFGRFGGWQEGYGAFTYAISEKDRLINYVKNQKEHHKYKDSRMEYLDILNALKVDYEDRFVE